MPDPVLLSSHTGEELVKCGEEERESNGLEVKFKTRKNRLRISLIWLAPVWKKPECTSGQVAKKTHLQCRDKSGATTKCYHKVPMYLGSLDPKPPFQGGTVSF